MGLGWDVRTTTGIECDLAPSAIVAGVDGPVLSDKHVVVFNTLASPQDAVVHGGDDLTGQGDDDEKIRVSLGGLPPAADTVAFCVAIYDADNRRQNVGQVRGAFIRVVNDTDQRELARYDLTEDSATETAMVFGEVYRSGADWKFRATGQGYASGLSGIAQDFGVHV